MLLQKKNLWDISFFESFLFCSRFQTMREKNSDFGNFVRKIPKKCFFLCVQRKNRATYVFSEKSRIMSKNNSTFYRKTFQRFVKTTLYVSSGQIWGKTFFVRNNYIIFGNLSESFRWPGKNFWARFSKLPSTCPQGNYKKKVFLEIFVNFVFFVYWAKVFDIMVFFFGQSSQEDVISRCPEDEFKIVWKFKIFLFLYLQLIIPALRTELGWGEEGGCQVFNVCVLWNHEGSEKICKVNTLIVVFGKWVIEWKFIFELWVKKKS